MQRRFFSRTGFILWIGATFGAICVLPYVFALAPQAIEDAVRQTGMTMSLIVVVSIVQSALFLGVMTFTGLWAANKVGLGAPLLDALVGDSEPAPNIQRTAGLSISLGIAGALVLIALDFWVFIPLDPDGLGSIQQSQPPAWMGLLASFYGGIAEEVQLRLFLFSILALGMKYLAGLLGLSKSTAISARLFWTVNIIVAVVFGLGHLPATAELIAITPLVVARAVVLNGIVGLIAGYLFWKKGIEMAMLCHFSADIVLHVLVPIVAS